MNLYEEDFEEEVFNAIKGGFPLININTREVDRVTKCLSDLTHNWNVNILSKLTNAEKWLKDKGYDFYHWDVINGWRKNYKELKKEVETKEVEDALVYVINGDSKTKTQPPGIYVMQNIHLWLDKDAPNYPLLLQLIREVHTAKTQYKHLFLVGVLDSLPIEIKDYFVTIDFDLPTEKVINTSIKKYTTDIGLKFSDKIIKRASSASRGMSLLEIEGAVSKALVDSKAKGIDPQIIFKEKARAVKKTNLLEYIQEQTSINTVGGLGEIKKWANLLSNVFKQPAKAEKYKLSNPKGCLLMGIQGCGKSLIAKAFSTTFGVPLYHFNVGRVFGGLVGETETNTREVLKLIDAVSPCCVLIDEIEKGLSGLNSSGSSDGGVTSRFIGSLLSWMEEKTSPSFIIATANDISKVPPELLRKGRFEELWFVDLPSPSELLETLKIHITLTGRNIKKYKKLKEVVKQAKGFTGAEVESIVRMAMFQAFSENREYTDKDLMTACKNIIPLSVTKKEDVQALRSWAKGRARRASNNVTHEKKKTISRKKPLY